MAKNIIRSNLQKKTTLHVEAFFFAHFATVLHDYKVTLPVPETS